MMSACLHCKRAVSSPVAAKGVHAELQGIFKHLLGIDRLYYRSSLVFYLQAPAHIHDVTLELHSTHQIARRALD